MTEEQFKTELLNIGINLTNYQLELFEKYKNFLQAENKKYNLTAIEDEQEIYLKHFYDCLTIVKNYTFNGLEKVLDIGSGAGFPGIVLKIVFKDIDLTLLDSNNKKTSFLTELIKILNLEKCLVINARSEIYVKNHREEFDVVTARAVAPLRILSELCLPFVKINGYFIALKGKKDEIIESKETITKLGGLIEKNEAFVLSNGDERRVIYIKKQIPTLKVYPRKYEIIIKKSL